MVISHPYSKELCFLLKFRYIQNLIITLSILDHDLRPDGNPLVDGGVQGNRLNVLCMNHPLEMGGNGIGMIVLGMPVALSVLACSCAGLHLVGGLDIVIRYGKPNALSPLRGEI